MQRRNQRDGGPVLVTGSGAEVLRKLSLGATAEAGAVPESFLQELMFEHPEVLPLEQIESGFDELVSVCREMPTKHGPIDNLFMTANGEVVIAEAKLWRNPEARRKVVAQALDYASCLFEMGYEEFEQAALKGDFGSRPRPGRLYELFPESDRLPEHEFVDKVSRNLRSGRIVVLVVGDGIRTETERLAEALQSHAGFRFTFALVELSVFALPSGERLVVPRTLARTQLIERGVVRIEGGGIAVGPGSPAPAVVSATRSVPGSISAEEFFEAMQQRDPRLPEALKAFLEAVAPLGVFPEFRRALNLRWETPSGRLANLGIIQRDGQVWTSESVGVLGEPLSREYNEALASALGGRPEPMPHGAITKWQVRFDGKIPRIEELTDKLGAWAEVLREFLPKVSAQMPED